MLSGNPNPPSVRVSFIVFPSAFLAVKHAGLAMQQVGKGGKEVSGGSIVCTASGK